MLIRTQFLCLQVCVVSAMFLSGWPATAVGVCGDNGAQLEINTNEQLAEQEAERREYARKGMQPYQLIIHVKAELPADATVSCYLKQIDPEANSLPGTTCAVVPRKGDVVLEVWSRPNDAPDNLYQIRIANHPNESEPDLWVYYSEPFKLDSFGPDRQREFTVDKLWHHKSLGTQKFQIVDAKNREYSKLRALITIAEPPSASAGAPFKKQRELVSDDKGVFTVPLFVDMDFDLKIDYRSCLIARPVATDGFNDYSLSAPREVMPGVRMISLVSGSGESLKHNGVKKVVANPAPIMIAKVDEAVDGADTPCRKIRAMTFDTKSGHVCGFGYPLTVDGRYLILTADSFLKEPLEATASFIFHDRYAGLQNDYELKPVKVTLAPQDAAGKTPELKFRLMSQASAHFSAVDAKTNKAVPGACLCLLDALAVTGSSASCRAGQQIPAA